MGEGCKRLWQAFSKGRRDILQQSCSGGHGHSSGRTRVPTPRGHSRSEQGLGLRFSDMPLENFTSPALLPSREHNGAGAGEASFIYRKGRTRFNYVKVKQGRGINPCDKHPEVCLSLGAFMAAFLPTRGALVQP